MKKAKRMMALVLAFVLVVSTMSFIVHAEDTAEVISINSDWKGSIFGDIGGNDKITTDNFEITENADGTVKLRSSNNRGKISNTSEGIAYYYKAVGTDENFELSATATVDSFVSNGQVSFGLMLRDGILENQSQGGNLAGYTTIGALGTVIQAFYKEQGSSNVKIPFSSNSPVNVDPTTPLQQYNLSIIKSGDIYTLKCDDAEPVILDNTMFSGKNIYAGLYTARNAAVTFSNIKLKIEGQIELGDWTFSAFGSNTSEEKNPDPTINNDGSITLLASGGKIASSEEGMSFYYKDIPTDDANFEISTKAKVVSFNSNTSISTSSQKSFGLMLKDEVGENGNPGKHTSNYAAVGALGTDIKTIIKQESQTKTTLKGTNTPSANEEYDLSIKKSGNIYILTCNGISQTVTLENMFSDNIFAGFYVSRDAEVTFSNFDIKVETKKVKEIKVDKSLMKTEYLLEESLDLTGLQVTAVYTDNSEKVLTQNGYVVTGFDSSVPGTCTISVNFNGKSNTIDLIINPLTATTLEIKYLPAKTDYYIGDNFDPEGFVVTAEYNYGYKTLDLTSDKYAFSIQDATVTQSVYESVYTFNTSGIKTVEVISTETFTTKTSFDVSVSDAEITGLEITKQPKKTLYFIGDELDLNGMVVYAKYSDNNQVRLMRGEYTVSSFDTASPGDKVVTVSHKGKTAYLPVVVKEKELVGIKITNYPKTTYYVGEDFDSQGLEVSKVFDNLDTEALSNVSYTIDSSAFDNTKAGEYDINIVPVDNRIDPVTLKITVREYTDPVWNFIRFGQSTSESKNFHTINEDGTIELAALDGGGKITGDHDGISYYYTVIDAEKDNFELSADIKVLSYAKTPHDGQESFGIMARDAIGTHGNSSVFASNIAAVGGYSGGTRNENGTQLFIRTGVESSDGAGSQGVQKIMLKSEKPEESNTYPMEEYKLTLARTNSGYTAKLNNGQEEIFYEPDILKIQDLKIYVGFYTARVAHIEISNIDFTVTAAKTDSPKIEPPKDPIVPTFEFVSLDKISKSDYNLMVKSNVNGTVTVKQGKNVIKKDAVAEAGKILSIPAALTSNNNTNFSVTFLPDDTQYLTSYDKMVSNFTVTMKTFVEDGDIYVSPLGTSDGKGTYEDPIDLDTAVTFVREGQKILMLDGTYVRNSMLEIKKYNDGTSEAIKYLYAAPGAKPVIDFDKKSAGVVSNGNYWHIKGIDFKRSEGNSKGFHLGGSNNIIELCRFYENGDTGLQISRIDLFENDKTKWPSNNEILNCTSFDNRDPSDNNADGFAAKLASGQGNRFIGCIAHNNIDDGWDLYTKAGTGAIGDVVLDGCIAYDNGFLTDGTVGNGDKNGFKLGGEGIIVPHSIKNSIAFGNGSSGFTCNSNPGIIIQNCTAFDNMGSNLDLDLYDHIAPEFAVSEFVSYKSVYKDVYDAETISIISDSNYLYDNGISVNKYGIQLSDSNFKSLERSTPYERDADGNIIWGDFLSFIAPAQPPARPTTEPTALPTSSPTDTPSIVNEVEEIKENTDGSITVKPKTTFDSKTGTVESTLDEDTFRNVLDKAKSDSKGTKVIKIVVPKAEGASVYLQTLPSHAVASDKLTHSIELSTEAGTVYLPGNMLKATQIKDAKNVQLEISVVDKDKLPEKARTLAGSKKVIDLELKADGKKIQWNNPEAPVKVSIPYEPTKEELQNHEFLVIWYIDDSGNINPVFSGRYNSESKDVSFTTTHLSLYSVAYVHKTFEDIENHQWAKNQIEVLASKGIIKGTSQTTFNPASNITRADFTILLVNALGLTASVDSNFSDVTTSDYYYEAVGIAKKLGIIKGQGDNKFNPAQQISRQDMMVITSNALKYINKLQIPDSVKALDGYSDKSDVSNYALDAVAAMIEDGLILGSNGIINPLGETTRAEVAALMYRIYNK